MSDRSFSACPFFLSFKVEISPRALLPLFMPAQDAAAAHAGSDDVAGTGAAAAQFADHSPSVSSASLNILGHPSPQNRLGL